MHDGMLGELMKTAGENAVVILMSDHGFHPDHLRPSSIPDIPAGPAVEHRDHGVLAIGGPGIKRGETVFGASLLDVTPTVLTMFGLPVGEDMDGRVLSGVFTESPRIEFVPSWEEIAGADGRHPTHTRLDPVAAHEAMEQMIALGYIARPDGNREAAIRNTVRELRYNLGEAYQDDGRHAEAHAIFSELYAADRDEQRFAVRLFVSCQALGLHDEMRRILEDLDGRHRELPRFDAPVVDYLKAQMMIAERRWESALAVLQRVIETNPMQPALHLQAGDLWARVRRNHEAWGSYRRALRIDDDSVQARLGLCRIALRRRRWWAALKLALEAVQKGYRNPVAHFLLGRALMGLGRYEQAADAFEAAITVNPNFPEAHLRLAGLLERVGNRAGALEHRELARRMRAGEEVGEKERRHSSAAIEDSGKPAQSRLQPGMAAVLVVTGLPRSGTSLMMQMLAAAGVPVLVDEQRLPDEDNPRGYLEFEPVKHLLRDSRWLWDARGKAVKIVAPLLVALPAGLACRVILCERDLDEVLDSQERMLRNRGEVTTTPERRRVLREEYTRTIERVKAMLAARAETAVLAVGYRETVADPAGAAERVAEFLGGDVDVERMAEVVDAGLWRNRRG
jgi:tetratricopeptide (TPR) repeat protein